MHFKYNINHQISLLPREVTISDIVKILEKEAGISQDSFYRDRAIKPDSDKEIPSDRLFAYADLFDCDVHDLYPREKKLKSIRARHAKVSDSDTVKRVGLR